MIIIVVFNPVWRWRIAYFSNHENWFLTCFWNGRNSGYCLEPSCFPCWSIEYPHQKIFRLFWWVVMVIQWFLFHVIQQLQEFLLRNLSWKINSDAIIWKRTKKDWWWTVNLMGTSAWYAPGAVAANGGSSCERSRNVIFPCCAWMQGQYGLKNIYLGVPVKTWKNGIEEIIELKLNEDEMKLLHTSAKSVKEMWNGCSQSKHAATGCKVISLSFYE